jgi:CheY-like chemotaxis protein
MPLPRILIVEDDKRVADNFARGLARFGECIAVESSPDVFFYLNYNPQVILLDICLEGDPVYKPQEAGIRILEKIRELPPPHQNIPVIVVTGCSEPEIEKRCQELKVADFFLKPVSIIKIRDAVKQALARWKQERQEQERREQERREREQRRRKLVDSSTVILFLTANPLGTNRIGSDQEFHDIDYALLGTEFGNQFDIRSFGAVRPSDLQSYLYRYRPKIVHFSGHGSKIGEIVLVGKSWKSHPVPLGALSGLFDILGGGIRCVVLNACYTERQAQAIAKHVDCVVGMSGAIADEASISFAIAFYRALGYGSDVKTAFELGRIQIDLDCLNESDRPKLIALNIDPSSIVFARND